MPRNASTNGDGFRVYTWPGGDTPLNRKYHAVDPVDLLSVTSIRTLAGIPYQLVNWQIGNVLTLATGSRRAEWRDYSKSTRGRKVEGYRADGPFPGEFVRRLVETEGHQEGITEVRNWLRLAAEEPRDVAAVRGSVVHKMIELDLPLEVITEDLIRKRFDLQWKDEGRKIVPDVTEEDIAFADNGMRQYWDMRAHVPFVVLAREPQVYNLTAGYAGSADVLIWFLGEWVGDEFFGLPVRESVTALQKQADAGRITKADILAIGGHVTVGDWKTAKGVYTGHVIQTEAYATGEFVAVDGLIDERLTDLLGLAMEGMVIHIRPDFWAVDIFPWREDIIRAFLGSVVFARFLAMHKKPDDLFTARLTGSAPDIERSIELDDDGE